jgi:hypothetical protein
MNKESSLSRQLEKLKVVKEKSVFQFLNYCGWKIVEAIPHNCLISCQCSADIRNMLDSDDGRGKVKETLSNDHKVNYDVINETDGDSQDVTKVRDVEDEIVNCYECNRIGNAAKEDVAYNDVIYHSFNADKEQSEYRSDVTSNSGVCVQPFCVVSKGSLIAEKNDSDKEHTGDVIHAWTGDNEENKSVWSRQDNPGRGLEFFGQGSNRDESYGSNAASGGFEVGSSSHGQGFSLGYGVGSSSYGHGSSSGYEVESSGNVTSGNQSVGGAWGENDTSWNGSSGASAGQGMTGWDGSNTGDDTYGGGD